MTLPRTSPVWGLAILSALVAAHGSAEASRPLVISETASLPRGLYVRVPGGELRSGSLVVATPPSAARAYLDSLGVRREARLLKRVAATRGEWVCARRDRVEARERTVPVRDRDRAGRDLPRWSGCRPLLSGEIFLLGDSPDSFDSRYFGPVSEREVTGPYRELVTW